MRYISTRGGIDPIGFTDAVMMGLSDDGGLLVPEQIPDVTDRLTSWETLDYPALALEVMSLYVSDLATDRLLDLVDRSYGPAFDPEVAPMVEHGGFHIMELWHGPTLAFKDVALQFLGNLFEAILERRSEHLNIVGATSGDTGSAAIQGICGKDRIRIFVMHPEGRVSPIQARQMTTVVDDNVFNLAMDGTFDDCQRLMKELSSDLEFKRRNRIGAVNSVNWARVLAQIVYYFHGALRLRREGARTVQFAVPTGNFGDILAGWYARQMGAPIERLVLATNSNDILTRFFTTGEYRLSQVHHTVSPSMDIQIASNFERYLFEAVGRDPARVRELMSTFRETGSLRIDPVDSGESGIAAGSASEEETLETIRTWHEREGYTLDPHTAVGVHVARSLGAREADPPTICLATAHPAKFPDAVRRATGEPPPSHPHLAGLEDRPTRLTRLPANIGALREFIEDAIARGASG